MKRSIIRSPVDHRPAAMKQTECANCGKRFPRRNTAAGLVKYSLQTMCENQCTANKVFPGVPFTSSICTECTKFLRSKTISVMISSKVDGVSYNRSKRRWNGDPPLLPDMFRDGIIPVDALSRSKDAENCHTLIACKTAANNSILAGRYVNAFRCLSKIPAAKKAMISVSKALASSEIRKVSRRNKTKFSITRLEVKAEHGSWMKEFSWQSVIEEARDKIPIVTCLLEGILPQPDRMKRGATKAKQFMSSRNRHLSEHRLRYLTPEEKLQYRDTRLGMILAVALNAHLPKRYKAMQQMIGIKLWLEGTSKKVQSLFGFLGLSHSRSNSRIQGKKLLLYNDTQAATWKEDFERAFFKEPAAPSEYNTSPATNRLQSKLARAKRFAERSEKKMLSIQQAADAKKTNYEVRNQQNPNLPEQSSKSGKESEVNRTPRKRCLTHIPVKRKTSSTIQPVIKKSINLEAEQRNDAQTFTFSPVPGQCPKCGKIFNSRPSYIKRHLILVHKLDRDEAEKYVPGSRRTSTIAQPVMPWYKSLELEQGEDIAISSPDQVIMDGITEPGGGESALLSMELEENIINDFDTEGCDMKDDITITAGVDPTLSSVESEEKFSCFLSDTPTSMQGIVSHFDAEGHEMKSILVPPAGRDGHEMKSILVPPAGRDGHEMKSILVPPAGRDGHEMKSILVPPAGRDGHEMKSILVPPAGREGHEMKGILVPPAGQDGHEMKSILVPLAGRDGQMKSILVPPAGRYGHEMKNILVPPAGREGHEMISIVVPPAGREGPVSQPTKPKVYIMDFQTHSGARVCASGSCL